MQYIKKRLQRLWPRRFIVQVTVLTSIMVVLGIAARMTHIVAVLILQQHRGTERGGWCVG